MRLWAALAATTAIGIGGCDDGTAPPGDADASDDAGAETAEDGGSEASGDVPDAGDDGEADGLWPTYTEEREPCADRRAERNLYFGDLHAHTRLSFDAWGYELRAGPEEALAFARGAAVSLPPLDPEGAGTRTARLARPLDFAAVTDHLDLAGEVRVCLTPGSLGYDSSTCTTFRAGGQSAVFTLGVLLADPREPSHPAEVCGEDGAACREAATTVWDEVGAAAEAAYDRTDACGFVSFVGYEYTASPQITNLHRYVLFRNAAVPALPPGYFEQPTAPGLWEELRATCLDAGTGCDAITVPHNANWSNGRLFALDYGGAADPEAQREYARLRARLEPLFEIFQHKGDQECMNGFAGVVGEPDPLCDFEKLHEPGFEDCGEGTGWGGANGLGCVSRLDFLRNVLKAGLAEGLRLGVNPYRLGVIGSTDTHNATPGNTEEAGFPGHVGTVDSSPELRLGVGTVTHETLHSSPGGLAAVWAVERSRDAIFDAFRRRETYATSGTRIAVRFFGGWSYPATLCEDADPAVGGYAGGVPMGAPLPARPAAGGAPTFLVDASADPGTAEQPGTPLQRVQIVKGWVDAAGVQRERVFEAAGDPDNGADVDLETCEPRGEGFERLCTVWTDPEFDPARPAFYYARVVENPSCRWSTRDCLSFASAERPETCDRLAATIQERAWTSAVWYEPPAP